MPELELRKAAGLILGARTDQTRRGGGLGAVPSVAGGPPPASRCRQCWRCYLSPGAGGPGMRRSIGARPLFGRGARAAAPPPQCQSSSGRGPGNAGRGGPGTALATCSRSHGADVATFAPGPRLCGQRAGGSVL